MTQLLTLFLTLLSIPSAYRMMVISDPHMLDSTQYIESSASFQNLIANDGKHPDWTDAAFTALMDSALNLRPDIVLIPGDLTYMGAKTDHLAAANQLRRLTNAGISVCLIPGNHDIVNTSYAYWGASATQVPSVTDAQFDSIYAFCHASFTNRRRDPNGSHSYVQTIAPRLTLLGFDGNHHDVSGVAYLSNVTLNWMMAQADSAVQAGDRVIAMLHQQMIEPVDNAATMHEHTFIYNHSSLISLFCDHGIDMLLTGHAHINDVSVDYNTTTGDSLVEISTGCPAVYPLPFRMITATDTFSNFVCETHYIQSLPSRNDVQTLSRTKTINYMRNIVIPQIIEWSYPKRDALLTLVDNIENYPFLLSLIMSKKKLREHLSNILDAIPQTPEGRAALVDQYLGENMALAALVHMDGNEGNQNTTQLQDDLWDGAQGLVSQLVEYAYPDKKSTRNLLNKLLDKAVPIARDDIGEVENEMKSYFGDYTHMDEDTQNRTDDLTPHLAFTHLTYMPPVHSMFSATACDDYLWNGEKYTKPGRYTQTLQNIHGCDSIVTLYLTLHKSVATQLEEYAYDEYDWNEQTYTQSGDYTQTFQTTYGCDSVVTLHLTILESPTTDLTHPMHESIIVYPNPASHQIHIQGDGIQNICVYSTAGQLIEQLPATNTMDIHHWAKGVYVLRIKQNDVFVYRQVMKQSF